MIRKTIVVACALLSAQVGAAPITGLSFSGLGTLTRSDSDIFPPVGSDVQITGNVEFVIPSIDSAATGTFTLSEDDVWRVSLGFDFIDSPGGFDNEFAQLTFVNGALTGLRFSANEIIGFLSLETSTFSGSEEDVIGGQGEAGYAGRWTLGDVDIRTAAVPEPASWALLITSFGAVGTALRRRRALATA